MEQDIVYSLNENKDMSEAEYSKLKITGIIIGCLLVFITAFKAKLVLAVLIIVLVLSVCAAILSSLLRKK